MLISLTRSLWGWIAVLGCAAVWAFLLSSRLDNVTGSARSIDVVPPASPFSLITRGTVEIDGGITQVSAPRTGTFKTLYVDEGDQVTQGQLLGEQEDRDDRLAVRRAEIAIENARIQLRRDELALRDAERELERSQILRSENAITEQEFVRNETRVANASLAIEASSNQLEDLENQLETAEFNLSQRRILSPVDGRVLEVAVTAGAGVSAENVSVAFRIISDGPRQIRVALSEDDIPKVHLNQIVSVTTLDGRGASYPARVISIGEVFSAALNQSSLQTNNQNANTLDVVVGAGELPFRLGQTVLLRFENAEETDRSISTN